MNNQMRNHGSDFIGGILAFLVGFPLVIILTSLFIDYWFYIVGTFMVLFGAVNLYRWSLDNRPDDL